MHMSAPILGKRPSLAGRDDRSEVVAVDGLDWERGTGFVSWCRRCKLMCHCGSAVARAVTAERQPADPLRLKADSSVEALAYLPRRVLLRNSRR